MLHTPVQCSFLGSEDGEATEATIVYWKVVLMCSCSLEARKTLKVIQKLFPR